MQPYLSSYDDRASGWQRALYAFLGEEQRRPDRWRNYSTALVA